MLQLLLGTILAFQFFIGLFRLKWSIGLFLFVFIVFPTYVPFLDFFGLNFVRSSIVVSLINLLIYHFSQKQIIQFSQYKSYFTPILWFSVLMLPSYIMAEYSYGFGRGVYLYSTYFFIEQFFPGIMLLFIIKSEKDFIYYIKWIALAVFAMGIFGIVEFIKNYNPFMDWVRSINSGFIVEYNEETRFFFNRRVQSTAWHPTAYGGYLSMIIILLMIFIGSKFKVNKFKGIFNRRITITIILILILILNIILTASRAVWLASFVSLTLVFIFNLKYFFNRNYRIKRIFMMFLLPIVIFYCINLYAYLKNEDVSGSTIEMRIEQFNYIKGTIGHSIYIGLGANSIEEVLYKTDQFNEALGFESIIFVFLVNNGVLGLIGLTILFITSYRNMYRPKKSFYSIFFFAILISHLILVILSGELRTFRVFWLLYSMLFSMHYLEIHRLGRRRIHLQLNNNI